METGMVARPAVSSNPQGQAGKRVRARVQEGESVGAGEVERACVALLRGVGKSERVRGVGEGGEGLGKRTESVLRVE